MDRKMFTTVMLLIGAIAVSPLSLLAHEGHGVHPASDATHYLLEWVHGAPVLMLALVLVIGGAYLFRKEARAKN